MICLNRKKKLLTCIKLQVTYSTSCRTVCYHGHSLSLNGSLLGNVSIRRGIFQGDALSPLIFVMCLFPLTILLRKLNKGFAIDGIVASHLLYLDDLKLYAKSTEEMLLWLIQ